MQATNAFFIPEDTGQYVFTAVVGKKYQSSDSFISRTDSVIFNILPKESLEINSIPLPSTPYKLNFLWVGILLSACLISILIALYLQKKVAKKEIGNKAEKILERFSSYNPPKEILWKNKNEYIQKDTVLQDWHKNLLQNVNTERLEINLTKTILKTIKNIGRISPVYDQKIKPKRYIVLIHHKYIRSTQFQLFKYIIQNFGMSGVPLEYFTFTTTAAFFDINNQPYTLNELASHHQQNALIIFSDGYLFIDYLKNDIEENIKSELPLWNNRVLVTPVSYLDWASEESIFKRVLPMVPADIAGLLDVVKILNDDDYFQNYSDYIALYLNFYSLEEIKNYLQDEDLMQWVCALAVYPKIYWQLILALGNTICPEKVNYENLLKLVRIGWVHEASFPVDIRLELLKELTVTNELQARELILKLINEELSGITEDMFVYEEKEIQRYTQSFVLFANDNSKSELSTDAEKFMILHKANKVTDTALKVYIDNEERQWETPIKYKQPAGEFIEGYHNKPRNRFLKISLIPLFILSGLLLLYHFYPGNEYLQKLKLVTADVKNNLIRFELIKDPCYYKYIAPENSNSKLETKSIQIEFKNLSNDSTTYINYNKVQ